MQIFGTIQVRKMQLFGHSAITAITATGGEDSEKSTQCELLGTKKAPQPKPGRYIYICIYYLNVMSPLDDTFMSLNSSTMQPFPSKPYHLPSICLKQFDTILPLPSNQNQCGPCQSM